MTAALVPSSEYAFRATRVRRPTLARLGTEPARARCLRAQCRAAARDIVRLACPVTNRLRNLSPSGYRVLEVGGGLITSTSSSNLPMPGPPARPTNRAAARDRETSSIGIRQWACRWDVPVAGCRCRPVSSISRTRRHGARTDPCLPAPSADPRTIGISSP